MNSLGFKNGSRHLNEHSGFANEDILNVVI